MREMIGKLRFASKLAVTGTSGSVQDEAGFKVKESSLSEETEIELTKLPDDATVARDGVEFVDLRRFLLKEGIFEENFDPTMKRHRIRVGNAILAWLRLRFPDASKILHCGDTSRVDSGQIDGECTVRDTGNTTLRDAHYVAHMDKHLPGIAECFSNTSRAEDGARIFADNYSSLNKHVWDKAGVSKEDVQRTVLQRRSGMLNVWVALTKGGITQHPLAILNPNGVVKGIVNDDEQHIRDRMHSSTVTLTVNFARGFTDSLSVIKEEVGKHASPWYVRPNMKFGEALMFSTCETPHSAVILKGVKNARRVSAEMRVLVIHDD